MAKRNFALAALVVMAAMFIGRPALAGPTELSSSCAQLAEVVREATVNDILAARGESAWGQPRSGVQDDGIRACNATSAAVTLAYVRALAQLGLYVRFHYLPAGSGNACLSHDLAFCNPFPDPMGPRLLPPALNLISESWNRVRGGIVAEMPWGSASDISYFRPASLSLSLQPSATDVVGRSVWSIHD